MNRLELSASKWRDMLAGLRDVAALPDPVGSVENVRVRPNGLRVGRMRIPLGVIGIIYESRPNVTVDAAALCLKAGNAVILRGGSEAIRANLALAARAARGGARDGRARGRDRHRAGHGPRGDRLAAARGAQRRSDHPARRSRADPQGGRERRGSR